MKKLLLVSTLCLLFSMNLNAQADVQAQKIQQYLKATMFSAPTAARNGQEITTTLTVMNTSTTEALAATFYLIFWEGINWHIYDRIISKYIEPGATTTFDLKGTIPSRSIINPIYSPYELRIYIAPPVTGTQYMLPLKDARVPFYVIE